MFKLLKSEKGYSLVEVGIGLIIITIFLISSVSLMNGAFNNYRIIEQRNIAMSYAIDRMENILGSDDPHSLIGQDFYTNYGHLVEQYGDPYLAESKMISANYNTFSQQEQLEGAYCIDEVYSVEGILEEDGEKVLFKDESVSNMVITTTIKRIPVTKFMAYDSSVLRVNVKVEYKLKPSDTEVKSFELSSVKVTKH